MKKVLIVTLSIVLVLLGALLIFGKVKIGKKPIETNFKDSNFFKEIYNSNSYVLVDVWSTSCEPCIAEVPNLKKIDTTNSLKFVTISIDEDTIKLKKFLSKSTFFRARDITLNNFTSRDSILSIIELSGVSKEAIGFSFKTKVIPYTVLIKNKKILYKSTGSGADIDSINNIISRNLKELKN